MPPTSNDQAATLAAISATLKALAADVGELKTDVKEIDRRLQAVEISVGSRTKPATVYGFVGAGVAGFTLLILILDRFYTGG